jgi:HSP20 family protein
VSEVKIRKDQSVAKRQPTDVFATMFPFGRSIGLSPFSWMRELTREMDRTFRGLAPLTESEAWVPAIDVQQCNGTLMITAELPGLKKNEVKVEVSDDALIIEGDREREHKEDHKGYHQWERSYGHFYRSIPLPEGAKTDQAKAELSEGVLRVSLPVEEVKRHIRQIAVEEGAKPTAA